MTELPMHGRSFDSASSPEDDASLVRRRLRAAWRAERRLEHLRGASIVAMWAVLLAWVMLIVDWQFEPDARARAVMLGAAGATLAAAAWRHWRRRLERFDPLAWALRLEASRPGLRSLLVSCVQLGDDGASGSAGLIATVRREAAEAVADMPIGPSDAGRVRTATAALLIAGGMAALGAVAFGEYFRVFGLRMSFADPSAAYPSWTTIESITGDRLVRRGEGLTVEAVAGGLTPGTATLELRAGQGAWQSMTLARGPGGRYSRRFTRVVQGFDYRFRIGDGRSRTYTVRVVGAPQVVQTRVTVAYPEYMEREAEPRSQLSVSVPRGSTLRWRLRFDRPVAEAELLEIVVEAPEGEPGGVGGGTRDAGEAGADGVGGDAGVGEAEAGGIESRPRMAEGAIPLAPCTLGEGGRVVTAEWRAERSVRYALRVVDAEHGLAHRRAIIHRIDVIDDAPPSVQWLGRRDRAMVVTAAHRLDLPFRASDDHGVRALSLVYAVNDGEAQRLPISDHDGDRVVEGRARRELKALGGGLTPGDVVTVAVEATDVRPDGRASRSGLSPALRLEVVDRAAYQRRVFDRLDGLLQRAEAARVRAEAERAAAGALGGGGSASEREGAGRPMVEALAEARQGVVALKRRVGGLAEAFDELASDVRRNGMAEAVGENRIEQMARVMQRADRRHLARAAGLLRAAREAREGSDARESEEVVAERARRAASHLEAAAGLIDRMLERGGERHVRARLAMEARRLTESQWRLRQRLGDWGREVIAGLPLSEREAEGLATRQRELRGAMGDFASRLGEAAGGASDRALRRAAQELDLDPPAAWAGQSLEAIEADRPLRAAAAADRAMQATAALAAVLWEDLGAAERSVAETARERLRRLGRDQQRLGRQIERAGAGLAARRAQLAARQRELLEQTGVVAHEVMGLPTSRPADALDEARAAMRRAIAGIEGGEADTAAEAATAAGEAIDRAIDRLTRIGSEGGGNGVAAGGDDGANASASGGGGGVGVGPGSAGAGGAAVANGAGLAEWDREAWRAVYAEYLDELPVEYRALLEDYYEVLSE